MLYFPSDNTVLFLLSLNAFYNCKYLQQHKYLHCDIPTTGISFTRTWLLGPKMLLTGNEAKASEAVQSDSRKPYPCISATWQYLIRCSEASCIQLSLLSLIWLAAGSITAARRCSRNDPPWLALHY